MNALDDQLESLRADLDQRITVPEFGALTTTVSERRQRRLGGAAVAAGVVGIVLAGSLLVRVAPATERTTSVLGATTSPAVVATRPIPPPPVTLPTNGPTTLPANLPTTGPADLPTTGPANVPASIPNFGPDKLPTTVPAKVTSGMPTAGPTTGPGNLPTSGPDSVPTTVPMIVPSTVPTIGPTTTGPAAENRYLGTVAMADANHGFALISYCRPDTNQCRQALAVTQDGRHWTERALPANQPTDGASSELVSVGPKSAWVDIATANVRTGYFTSDSGLTWKPVPGEVSSTAEVIPAGGVLQADCPPGGPADGCARSLTVRVPGNGSLAKLAHQPDIAVSQANAAPLADGSWWVSGTKNGRQALAVSRDGGRSWISSLLPKVAGEYLFTSPVTAGGGRLWALAIGQLPNVKNGLLAVYRSLDAGRTWTLAFTEKAGREPRTALGVGIATGRNLLVCDEGLPQHGWLIADGAASFVETSCPATGWVGWSRAGYLIRQEAGVSTSADGVSWHSAAP